MKITAITASNLKAHASLKLQTPGVINYIYGDNGTGKTAILEAVYTGCLGIGRRGKKPSAIMEMAGPKDTMEITLEAGKSIMRRAWQRTPKGAKAVKTPEFEPPFSPICINAAEFLLLTGKQQIEMIAGRFGSTGNPRETIDAAVKKVAPAHASIKAESLETYLPLYEEFLREKKNESASVAKLMVGALRAAAALESAPPVYDAEKANGKKDRLASLKAQIELYEKNTSEVEASLKRYADTIQLEPPDASARDELSTLVAKLRAEKQASIAASAIRKTTQTSLDKCNAKLAEFEAKKVAPPSDEILSRYDSEEEARTEWAMIQRELQELEDGETALTVRVVLSENNKFAAFEHAGSQYEGTPTKALNDLLKVFLSQKAAREDRRSRLEQKTQLVQEWLDASASLSLLEFAESLKEEKSKLEEALQGVAIFSSEKEQALQDAVASLEELAIAQSKYEAYEAKNQALVKAKQKLYELKNSAPQINEMKAESEALRTELELVAITDKAFAEWEAAKRQNAKAEEEAKKAEEEAAKWDTALKTFLQESASEAQKLMTPLLERARQFTKDCLPSELANNGTRIGRYEGVHFIPLEEFSGSEQALAVAAIAAALAKPGEGLVMIDEFNVCVPQKKAAFLRNLMEAVDLKMIEQAFIFDNAAPPCSMEGLHAIAL